MMSYSVYAAIASVIAILMFSFSEPPSGFDCNDPPEDKPPMSWVWCMNEHVQKHEHDEVTVPVPTDTLNGDFPNDQISPVEKVALVPGRTRFVFEQGSTVVK